MDTDRVAGGGIPMSGLPTIDWNFILAMFLIAYALILLYVFVSLRLTKTR
jgi:hypothetical protein